MKFLKIVGVVFGIFIALGILGAILGPSPSGTKSFTAGYQAGKQDVVIPDKDLVNKFYRELRDKTDKADDLYKPFGKALESSDALGATQVALQIDQPFRSLWGDISRLETPKLQNEAASKKLSDAKDAFANCYLKKSIILSDFIKYSESPNMKKVAEISNNAKDAQTLMLGGIMYMTQAGEMVGLKMEDFSTK